MHMVLSVSLCWLVELWKATKRGAEPQSGLEKAEWRLAAEATCDGASRSHEVNMRVGSGGWEWEEKNKPRVCSLGGRWTKKLL
jgi:hypothetical protein